MYGLFNGLVYHVQVTYVATCIVVHVILFVVGGACGGRGLGRTHLIVLTTVLPTICLLTCTEPGHAIVDYYP